MSLAVEEVASPELRVGDSGPKGRGVFAGRSFREGDLIESAPVIVIPAEEWPVIEKTVIYHYGYAWGKEMEDIALALGYGSLYNHSYHPNAKYVRRTEHSLLDFVAIRAIRPGEEITINYNGAADERDPVWFRVYE